MINGIVGLDAKEAEELQIASPHFTSNMYQIDHLRSLLEQDIVACLKRKQEITGKNLTGEYIVKEGEIWENLGDCFGASMSLEYCLSQLKKISSEEPFDDEYDGSALDTLMQKVKTEEAMPAHMS
jgi:hypothetical protein